jgi:hypothetical protein
MKLCIKIIFIVSKIVFCANKVKQTKPIKLYNTPVSTSIDREHKEQILLSSEISRLAQMRGKIW